jgi:PTH1 family peptidyl-tRNA hydrolase
MKLIVGLGNPGEKYAKNRHNLGFMCLDALAKKHAIKFDKKQGQARTATTEIGGETVVLARSQTYMNESGQAVRWLVQRYNLEPADVIVIHDDMDLPLGKIRIRQGGSAAGHNGIKSIINQTGDPDFIRIRVGIGHPDEYTGSENAVISFVLNNFKKDEQKVIGETIPKVSEAVESIITDGLNAAMNKYNQNETLKTKLETNNKKI